MRVELPRSGATRVNAALVSDHPEADPGSLWTISDQAVVDRSPAGGGVDETSGRTRLDIPTVIVGHQRYAFFIYRAPRNFDRPTGSTAHVASRTVELVLHAGRQPEHPIFREMLTIVRPLVVFVHGTFANNDAWVQFPLWQNSANELQNFQPLPGTLPFAADRISFNWIWNATGGVVENAETILAQLVASVRYWREATGAAATQADVVTHSFGGFVARQTAQTQPDPNPLASDNRRNFRAAANWGHGPIHKLITLAATHRGSAGANASAYLNRFGNQSIEGKSLNLRGLSCVSAQYIDRGALRDQLVLSQALLVLRETRVPGHVIVGSGRAVLDPSDSYKDQAELIVFAVDTPSGPYASAFTKAAVCPYDALANYTFNLNPDVPPLTGGSQCTIPDYDLTVSAYSSQGLLPNTATTTTVDLEDISGLELIGRLNHTALHDPSAGSPEIVAAVSSRVLFLLQQPTTNPLFSHFPAVASVAPTALEQTFSDPARFDPTWLELGSDCPPPTYIGSCDPYTEIKVIPERLVLQDATPTPLYVYGRRDGQWILAYAPSASFIPGTQNCPLTFTSSDPAIVTFMVNTVTGAQTVVATGVGTATIEVTVQGFGGSVSVPVTVQGVGD